MREMSWLRLQRRIISTYWTRKISFAFNLMSRWSLVMSMSPSKSKMRKRMKSTWAIKMRMKLMWAMRILAFLCLVRISFMNSGRRDIQWAIIAINTDGNGSKCQHGVHDCVINALFQASCKIYKHCRDWLLGNEETLSHGEFKWEGYRSLSEQ